MKERPILFSGPMVCAILNQQKTQTRRLLRRQTSVLTPSMAEGLGINPKPIGNKALAPCPYGMPGDKLWVRETWAAPRRYDDLSPRDVPADAPIIYAATEPPGTGRWRPSIHLPRRHARLVLEITDLRVEPLNDISEADARAEGVGSVREFMELWQQLNQHRAQWYSNPWVWVISFQLCGDPL